MDVTSVGVNLIQVEMTGDEAHAMVEALERAWDGYRTGDEQFKRLWLWTATGALKMAGRAAAMMEYSHIDEAKRMVAWFNSDDLGLLQAEENNDSENGGKKDD